MGKGSNRRPGEPGFHTTTAGQTPPTSQPVTAPPAETPTGTGTTVENTYQRFRHVRKDPRLTDLPTVTFHRVHHLGTFNPEDKGSRFPGSYEGSGLSISLHPDAWRRIARLGGEPEWVGTKEGNRFLSQTDLTDEQKAAFTEWGVANGYLEQVTRWRVTSWDDELDAELYSDYPTLDEAEVEAYEPEDISTVQTYAATDKLAATTGIRAGDTIGADDMVLTVYTETETDYDGVYWDDILDPAAYSAPRGVISAKRVAEWDFRLR